MEDDEEFAYTGYSENTARQLKEHVGYVTGGDEEYSFHGFDETDGESARADGADRVYDYGDFIVEEFSPVGHAHKVTQLVRIPEVVVTYAFSALYIIVGVLCVAFTAHIRVAFPYIVGGFMTLLGTLQFISAVRTKEYVHTHSNKTATSLILVALGVMIMVEAEWAMTFIAIVWGVLGLMEGAHAFNHAFSRIARSERCVYYLVKGLVELVLAFMLLHDPAHHIELHIVVFGIQLLFDAVTMMPAVKNFLSKK